MAAKLTKLIHKAAIHLHPVAESCTIYSSRSRAASPETFGYTIVCRAFHYVFQNRRFVFLN